MNSDERRVWLVGPDTYDTVPALARAFERLGWVTVRRPYRLIRTPCQRWLWRLAPRLRWRSPQGLRPWLEARWYNRFLREAVISQASSCQPDLMVFLRPYRLETDTRQALAALNRPLVTWATDSLTRYGRFAGVWDIAARNFVFDGGDLRKGKTIWLPLGFDDEVYQPARGVEWDVLFVGRIYARVYESRTRFFQRLADSELPSTYRVAHAGSVVRQHQDLKERFSQRGGVCLGDLTIPDLARAISRSKIAICVHQNDGLQPVNPMFFAIPGCQTCLVTDRRDYLGRWLQPEEEFVPGDLETVGDCIKSLLRQDSSRTQLAERGYRAAQKHTWVKRIETILATLELPTRV